MPIRKEHITLVEDVLESALKEKAPGTLRVPETGDPLWNASDPALKKAALFASDAAETINWPLLTASDYLSFTRTGERAAFEKKYFLRRRKLNTLVLGTCFSKDPAPLLNAALDGISLILDEASWCLPAHNSKIRDTPQEPLPDPDFPIIDLFAAESGALLGLTGAILAPSLSQISPYPLRRIRKEIRERITSPYLTCHFWWMGDGRSQMLNWTPWITQNVLLSVFSGSDHSEEEAVKILRQAALSLDYFLDEYGDDGCCCEGAQYYSHAGLCLFGSLELMNELLGGHISKVFSNPLIGRIADYIRAVHVQGPWYINYSDCSPLAGHRSAREYLFGKRTGNADLSLFAAEDYKGSVWFGTGKEETEAEKKAAVTAALLHEDDDGRLLLSEENLWYHLLQIRCHSEMLKAAETGLVFPVGMSLKSSSADHPHSADSACKVSQHAESRSATEDVWYPSSGLLLSRDSRTFFAMKAGGNHDPHNHNDTGSITVYRDGQPFLIDLGVETYTAKTFSKDRYSIWTMRSPYHNVMTFLDGDHLVEEKAGAQYHAINTVCEMTDTAASLSMELAPAFGDPRIRSVSRRVIFHRNKPVFGTILDSVDADLPCVLSLLTYEKPVETPKGIRIGNLGYIKAEKAGEVRIERLPIQDARLAIAWKHDCFRILIPFSSETLRVDLIGA